MGLQTWVFLGGCRRVRLGLATQLPRWHRQGGQRRPTAAPGMPGDRSECPLSPWPLLMLSLNLMGWLYHTLLGCWLRQEGDASTPGGWRA